MLTIVVAMADHRVIGRDGGLPWRLPDDLKRFRQLTTGHTVIMGRRTFESIGRPLPERRNIVLSHKTDTAQAGVEVASSLDEALRLATGDEEVFVIGGAAVYREALPLADRLHLTRVHAAPDGDTYFPPLDESEWRLVYEEHHPADARHEHAFTVQILDRAAPKAGRVD